MNRMALALLTVALSSVAQAQFPTGTWVQRGDTTRFSMTVDRAGSGYRLTYTLIDRKGKVLNPNMLTMVTQLDGKDAVVYDAHGKPTAQTIAVTRIDAHHTHSVMKVNGRVYGTSDAELSGDAKLIKIVNDMSAMGNGVAQAGKKIDYWDKK